MEMLKGDHGLLYLRREVHEGKMGSSGCRLKKPPMTICLQLESVQEVLLEFSGPSARGEKFCNGYGTIHYPLHLSSTIYMYTFITII